MTKEEELMGFLHEKVFDPILASKNVPANIKSGVHLTIARLEQRDAAGMVNYFWSALITENAKIFSKKIKEENLPRFEDVREEFRDRFNDDWLRR